MQFKTDKSSETARATPASSQGFAIPKCSSSKGSGEAALCLCCQPQQRGSEQEHTCVLLTCLCMALLLPHCNSSLLMQSKAKSDAVTLCQNCLCEQHRLWLNPFPVHSVKMPWDSQASGADPEERVPWCQMLFWDAEVLVEQFGFCNSLPVQLLEVTKSWCLDSSPEAAAGAVFELEGSCTQVPTGYSVLVGVAAQGLLLEVFCVSPGISCVLAC